MENNQPSGTEELDISHKTKDNETVESGRRDAVSKLAYATPVIAGLLFSKSASAATSLPPPPPPPNP